jgi:hypothetical protein
MDQYIREEEEFVERLKSLGKTFGDDLDGLQVFFFMKGLHSRYEMQAEVYSLMEKPYDDVVSHFRSLSIQKEGKKLTKPEAHASSASIPNGGRKKGKAGAKPPRTTLCSKCGQSGHQAHTCNAVVPLDADGKAVPICFYCKERGHIATVCPKKETAIVPTK